MSYKNLIKLTFIMLIFDYIWIAHIAKKIYFETINKIDKSEYSPKRYISAVFAYICLLYLIWINQDKSSNERFIIGIAIYGLFNFTNGFMFSDWNSTVIVLDTIWGGTLFITVPLLAKLLTSR